MTDFTPSQVEVKEETYPWWRFLVRLCAVIGGVYATVGMLYSLASNIGKAFRNFTENSNAPYAPLNTTVTPTTDSSSSKPLHDKPKNILTGNATIWSAQSSHLSSSAPTFETPVVQFVGQGESVKSEQLCDIASDSKYATNLDSDNDRSSNMLPDLLSSHAST